MANVDDETNKERVEKKLKEKNFEKILLARAVLSLGKMSASTRAIKRDGSRPLRSKTTNYITNFLSVCSAEQPSDEAIEKAATDELSHWCIEQAKQISTVDASDISELQTSCKVAETIRQTEQETELDDYKKTNDWKYTSQWKRLVLVVDMCEVSSSGSQSGWLLSSLPGSVLVPVSL